MVTLSRLLAEGRCRRGQGEGESQHVCFSIHLQTGRQYQQSKVRLLFQQGTQTLHLCHWLHVIVYSSRGVSSLEWHAPVVFCDWPIKPVLYVVHTYVVSLSLAVPQVWCDPHFILPPPLSTQVVRHSALCGPGAQVGGSAGVSGEASSSDPRHTRRSHQPPGAYVHTCTVHTHAWQHMQTPNTCSTSHGGTHLALTGTSRVNCQCLGV